MEEKGNLISKSVRVLRFAEQRAASCIFAAGTDSWLPAYAVLTHTTTWRRSVTGEPKLTLGAYPGQGSSWRKTKKNKSFYLVLLVYLSGVSVLFVRILASIVSSFYMAYSKINIFMYIWIYLFFVIFGVLVVCVRVSLSIFSVLFFCYALATLCMMQKLTDGGLNGAVPFWGLFMPIGSYLCVFIACRISSMRNIHSALICDAYGHDRRSIEGSSKAHRW